MRRANVNRIRFLFLNIRNISITAKTTIADINEGTKPVTCLTVPAIVGKIINTRNDTITRAIFTGKDLVSLVLAKCHFLVQRSLGQQMLTSSLPYIDAILLLLLRLSPTLTVTASEDVVPPLCTLIA